MLPSLIEDNFQWWITGAIIVLGLCVYGLGDLKRLIVEGGIKRAWAISGVCFAESIRRRVLWIAPLAILGVLGVSQFIRGSEQDIIRQTIKYSLFATGMVVTVTAIILACTNLPKEIENRVIYTIVTKPTTRLEIVVGKVLGFAKVSLAILLIMGLFTFAYLHVRAWGLQRDIQDRLNAGLIEPLARPTYEYWAKEGLLSSRTFENPDDLQIFAREPGADTRRWFFGGGDGDFLVPFYLDAKALTPEGVPNAQPGDAGLVVQLRIAFDRSEYTGSVDRADVDPSMLPTTAPGARPAFAQIILEFLDSSLSPLVDPRLINGGMPITITDSTGAEPIHIELPPDAARSLLRSPLFYINVIGASFGIEYSVDIAHEPRADLNPVCVFVLGNAKEQTKLFGPIHDGTSGNYQPALPTFRGKGGLYGQLLRGGPPRKSPVAVYKIRGAPARSADGTVPFELRVRIELNSGEADETDISHFEVVAANRKTGQRSPPLPISPESNRTAYFSLPANVLADGDFDVYIRNLGTGHYATMEPNSLMMVASEDSFNGNLLRSLAILWMLSILVVIISICCSTFLSWPIAIVLTLLLLLGHWGIMQVRDSLAPGIGNQVAQDIFGSRDASEARVVSDAVEAMARMLNQLARVLPDIGKFSAVEDIERGVTISAPTFLAPLQILVAFGLPMLVMSYVFLRNKEVAP